MVSDQFQVRGKKRIFLNEIKQIVGARAWDVSPVAGEIIPYGNACRTPCANACLPLRYFLRGLVQPVQIQVVFVGS